MALQLGSSAASKAYVGASAASKIYLGSSLVADFAGGGGATERTVFGASAPTGSSIVPVTTYNDLGVNGWTGSHFYLASNPGGTVQLVGGRLWVPTGSGMIGLAAKMGYYIQTAGKITRANSVTTQVVTGFGSNPQVTKAALVAGWNEFRLPTPLTVPWDDGIAIGFSVGTGIWYIAGPTGTADKPATQSAGGPLYLSEDNATVPRGVFGNYNPSNGSVTGQAWAFQGGWYGPDIILSW